MGGDAEVSDNVTKGGRFGNAKMGKRKKGRKMKRREGSLEEGRNGRKLRKWGIEKRKKQLGRLEVGE